MKERKINLFYIILYIIVGILYCLFFYELIIQLNVFLNCTYYLLILMYFLLGIIIYLKKHKYLFIIYLGWLIILLFSRISKSGINFNFYLPNWLKYIHKNKIIMLNVYGNILLFIPMGYFLKDKISYGTIIIIFLELMQYITSRGLFDIVDIVLNHIGLYIGWMGVKIWEKIKKKKNKKNNLKKN